MSIRGTSPRELSATGRLLLVVSALAVLLALNLWISSLIPNGHERIRVPYTPTFIQQVQAGNVKSISSKGSTVQGEFRAKASPARIHVDRSASQSIGSDQHHRRRNPIDVRAGL